MICKFFYSFQQYSFFDTVAPLAFFSDNIYNEEIKKDGMSVVL